MICVISQQIEVHDSEIGGRGKESWPSGRKQVQGKFRGRQAQSRRENENGDKDQGFRKSGNKDLCDREIGSRLTTGMGTIMRIGNNNDSGYSGVWGSKWFGGRQDPDGGSGIENADSVRLRGSAFGSEIKAMRSQTRGRGDPRVGGPGERRTRRDHVDRDWEQDSGFKGSGRHRRHRFDIRGF